jgi:hypothetical protein
MIIKDAPEIRRLYSEKIGSAHLQRLAVVYVRQSTPQQVLDHRESTQLQYGLVTCAQEMGSPKDRVLLIDDDLGKSGASSEGRAGFRRLVSEVSLDHAGIILGVEWKHAPLTAASQEVEDGVEDLARRPLARAPSGLGGRDERGEDLPFWVRKIAGIQAKR